MRSAGLSERSAQTGPSTVALDRDATGPVDLGGVGSEDEYP
jgi:hypothetical protein